MHEALRALAQARRDELAAGAAERGRIGAAVGGEADPGTVVVDTITSGCFERSLEEEGAGRKRRKAPEERMRMSGIVRGLARNTKVHILKNKTSSSAAHDRTIP